MARTEIGGKHRKVNRKIKNKKANSKEERQSKQRKKTGPHLPSSLQKELGLINPKHSYSESDSDEDDNAYEYEEGVAVEETKKNRRFDQVDNLEYELPEEFEDEDLQSDYDFDGEEEEENDGNHARMLHDITGIPTEAFEIKRTKEPHLMDLVEVGGSDTKISIHDLLDDIHGKKGYNELRKRVNQMKKKPMALSAPLPKVHKEKIERKAAYDQSKADISKWDMLVKRNREAPTVYFGEDRNLGFSTVEEIAAEFQPRTEFEKKMDALVRDPKVVEAHKNDGISLLELNEVSIEDVRQRQNCLAKMRSLLFHHEIKQKRIKKIKSKTYHRILKKDKSKPAFDQTLTDPEAILKEAEKQEFRRAEERLTLKHKNKSKWAKRILQRGLKAQDEGTRAALAEQLHQHEMLKRKMNSMGESSSDGSSSEDEYDQSPEIDKNAATKLLLRAKEETNKVIEEEGEIPKSGALSMPFMVRSLKKKMEAVNEEAQVALQEYDKSLGNLEDVNGTEIRSLKSSGRKTFGAPVNHSKKTRKKVKRDIILYSSDSEADIGINSHEDKDTTGNDKTENKLTPRTLGGQKIGEESNTLQDFDGHTTSSKTTYEVALFASGSWKKVKSETSTTKITEAPLQGTGNGFVIDAPKGVKEKNELESDQEMDDGFLTSDLRPEYELPSQSDLMHHAFAGGDVEIEFENDKMKVLNDENPEPEKPVLLPGWGQWTDVQQKKGLPSWMVKEHEDAKRKRDEALRKRKDALLKHVIISEKTAKHAEKLQTKNLPFPFTSKEIFERSIRMPIGPDYNPAISVGAINRPAVIKESGIVIKPIQFEKVDPHEKGEQKKRQKTTTNKNNRERKKVA